MRCDHRLHPLIFDIYIHHHYYTVTYCCHTAAMAHAAVYMSSSPVIGSPLVDMMYLDKKLGNQKQLKCTTCV